MTGIPVSLLDNIRISNGPDELRNYFSDLLHTERSRLLDLLNDRHLRFYTLYLLKSSIYASHLQENLIPMYKWALAISDKMSEMDTVKVPGGRQANRTAKVRKILRSDTEVISAALKWIVESGWDPDIPEGRYELLMERCTALLLTDFKDRSALPVIADVIFDRHRRGMLIHNLVWAFCEARDPGSLYLLAQRLSSANGADIRLAKKLLGFIPGIDISDVSARSASYYKAIRWLSENRPYIYFTGETMQMTGSPIICEVSLEAKYLNRPVSADSGKLLTPLSDHEAKLLSDFRRLTLTQRQQMADFSSMLNSRDMYQWASWIRLPVSDQLAAASHMTGGLV